MERERTVKERERTVKESERTVKESDQDKKTEATIYHELQGYLTQQCYPAGATKHEKCVIRKRAQSFQMVDGILHYKAKEGSLRQASGFTHLTRLA